MKQPIFKANFISWQNWRILSTLNSYVIPIRLGWLSAYCCCCCWWYVHVILFRFSPRVRYFVSQMLCRYLLTVSACFLAVSVICAYSVLCFLWLCCQSLLVCRLWHSLQHMSRVLKKPTHFYFLN